MRSIAAAEGYTIKASDLGKTKMFCQVVAISVMLPSVRHPQLRPIGLVLMWGVVFFALVSAVSYFAKFWHKVDESVKNRRRRELLTLERKRQRAAAPSETVERVQAAEAAWPARSGSRPK